MANWVVLGGCQGEGAVIVDEMQTKVCYVYFVLLFWKLESNMIFRGNVRDLHPSSGSSNVEYQHPFIFALASRSRTPKASFRPLPYIHFSLSVMPNEVNLYMPDRKKRERLCIAHLHTACNPVLRGRLRLVAQCGQVRAHEGLSTAFWKIKSV